MNPWATPRKPPSMFLLPRSLPLRSYKPAFSRSPFLNPSAFSASSNMRGSPDEPRFSQELADALRRLSSSEASTVLIQPSGAVSIDPAPQKHRVVLCGSFNPLHAGHEMLLKVAVARVRAAGLPVSDTVFELSVRNADKGLLDSKEVLRRAAQFPPKGLSLILTRAPLFTGKAEALPGSYFVVGYDTAIRLVDPKYHNGDLEAMRADFERFRGLGCSFVVGGRLDKEGRFRTLEDVAVPPELSGLFLGISADAFREDISSTQLRALEAASGAERVPDAAPKEGSP